MLADLATEKQTPTLLGIVLLISLIATFAALSPELWDRYRVVNDAQNFYRMARFQDPEAFTVDPQTGAGAVEFYLGGRPVVLYPRSLGYGLLFYAGSFVMDYIWLMKLSVFALMPLCIIYLFKFGQCVDGNLAGLSLSLFFIFFILASYQSISIASGLQRAFAVPLMIMFLYHLMRGQHLGVGVTLVGSALIYLPNFPILALAYTLSLVRFEPPFKFSLTIAPSKLLQWAGSLFLSGLVIAFALAVEFKIISFPATNTSLTDNHNPDSLLSQQLLEHSQGYAEMFFGFPFLGRAGVLDAGTDAVNMIVLLVLGVFIYLVVGPPAVRRMPAIFKPLLIASFFFYFLSLAAVFWASSLTLYFPSRYTRVTLFVTALYFVGLNWPLFMAKAPQWFRKKAPQLIFFVVTLSLALALVTLLLPASLPVVPFLYFAGLLFNGFLVVAGGSYLAWLLISAWPPGQTARFALIAVTLVIMLLAATQYIKTLGLRTINPSSYEQDIYAFAASLPKNAVLAGNPEVMSGVPLFARRPVLFSALHPDINAPILDYFKAQYAESPQVAIDFCRRYRVNYLVVDVTNFTSDYLSQKDFFYQPYNDLIAAMVSNRSQFIVPQLEPVFTSGPYSVIKCDAETLLAGH